MDCILLWFAREIGADFDPPAVFNEPAALKTQRLRDQADVVIIAMSAAAYPEADWMVDRPPVLAKWVDSSHVPSGWTDRHIALGHALQAGLVHGSIATMRRPPKAGEFAIWRHKPGLPSLVRSVSGSKAFLIEPGAAMNQDKAVALS
jgi:hypothetical protein